MEWASWALQDRVTGVTPWNWLRERGGERGEEGGGGGGEGSVRSSPSLKLHPQEWQEEDGQEEPHSQSHLPADGLWTI